MCSTNNLLCPYFPDKLLRSLDKFCRRLTASILHIPPITFIFTSSHGQPSVHQPVLAGKGCGQTHLESLVMGKSINDNHFKYCSFKSTAELSTCAEFGLYCTVVLSCYKWPFPPPLRKPHWGPLDNNIV